MQVDDPVSSDIAHVSSHEPWSIALDSMEQHVDQITLALHGTANFPGEFATQIPDTPLPVHLAARAQLLVARQRDVEAELRRRAGVLGAFIFGDRRPEMQTGVSVDVRS